MFLLLSTSLLLVAVTPAFTAVTPGYQQPPPCLQGQACRHSYNRSYMNNTVYCCPNGLGLSVMSNGYTTHCACGNNSHISSSIAIDGQRMSREMRRRMQRFQERFQAQMAAFNRQMSNMGRNLGNMFRGGFW